MGGMMSNRHIAVIAPPWYPIPPVGYGGIEIVLDLLVKELRARGDRVTLYACEGTKDAVTLAPAGWDRDLGKEFHEMRSVAYAARVLEDLQGRKDVDLIHDHAGWSSLLGLAFSGASAPILHTVHGPVYEQQETTYASMGDRVGLVAISNDQKSHAPDLNWVGTVYNAVDLPSLAYGSREAKQPYLLALARITPEKGQHIAIEVAKRTGMRLIMAGKVGERESEREYFEKEIAPHIDGRNIMYIPNVAGRDKAKVLAHATALLAPVTWPEPFGLYIAEAMVSGTPVIGLRKGSVPELVTEGVTGFVCDDADGMVARVKDVVDLDTKACATRGRDQFSPHAMARNYHELYEKTIEGHRREKALTMTPPPIIEGGAGLVA